MGRLLLFAATLAVMVMAFFYAVTAQPRHDGPSCCPGGYRMAEYLSGCLPAEYWADKE
jgi:hypothetical protein